MFDVLVESNRKGRRDVKGTVGGMLTSTVLQTALIAAAVVATQQVVDHTQEDRMDTIQLILDEPKPDEPEPEPEEAPPVITSLNPPPKGFQVLSAPIDIPTEIPPIDLNQRFDPRDFSGVGVEGGVFQGVEGGTGDVTDLSQVFSESVVDETPERLSCPVPQYPRMMQQANVEGNVLLQFVVETNGHVERNNIEVLSSTHRAFEAPARDMIQKCLFRPGRVRANAVRVLVQMPIVFTLSNR
ncbi:MAG TPA: energy transducer TonB [Gemmatimonadales bacterium]